MRTTLLLLAVLAVLSPTLAMAANKPECTSYAQRAMAQVRQFQGLGCPAGAPRWSTDEGLHYGYCIWAYDNNQVQNLSSETAARDRILTSNSCYKPTDRARRSFD